MLPLNNPNPFDDGTFRQELNLKEGLVQIDGSKDGLKAQIKIWVDVFRPVIHMEVVANRKITMEAGYESWRHAEREVRKLESFANSYKWAVPEGLNTWKYDPEAVKFRSHVGWKQDNIFAARLGLTDEAERLSFLKLADSGRRFPAFGGPGFDWTPDHNWGGSGMIGIQEMLLQFDGDKIHLFPAWPADHDVHFKLHAPKNTIVEAKLKDGKIAFIKVFPEERRIDIVSVFQE